MAMPVQCEGYPKARMYEGYGKESPNRNPLIYNVIASVRIS